MYKIKQFLAVGKIAIYCVNVSLPIKLDTDYVFTPVGRSVSRILLAKITYGIGQNFMEMPQGVHSIKFLW